jgi:hypothetical protein
VRSRPNANIAAPSNGDHRATAERFHELQFVQRDAKSFRFGEPLEGRPKCGGLRRKDAVEKKDRTTLVCVREMLEFQPGLFTLPNYVYAVCLIMSI